MNTELFDLALLFTSAFVGATIAFLAALVTFTFHNEIRERLVQEGLLVPPNGPPTTEPPHSSEHWSNNHSYSEGTPALLAALKHAQQAAAEQRTRNENNQDRHIRIEILPHRHPPPGNDNSTTLGPSHQIPDPVASRPTGLFGLPHPSTSWTGINPWPLSSSLSTYRPSTSAAPRLGRAPWPALADVLEDRTASLSPPPVELSVYHPLQTMTPHPTPTPSLTGTSPSRFESAPTSPRISRPTSPTPRTSDPRETSSFSRLEERRIPLTSTAPTTSGPSLTKLIETSWGPPEPRHGVVQKTRCQKTGRSTAFQAHENPWPSTSPSTGASLSTLPMPRPYPSALSVTPTERYGTQLQDEGYLPFGPRTAEEQGALEHALACNVWQEAPWRSRAAM